MDIIETAVYDGRYKVWRMLNLTTGSIYTSDFPSEDAALAAIEDGTVRNGYKVRRVRLRDVEFAVSSMPDTLYRPEGVPFLDQTSPAAFWKTEAGAKHDFPNARIKTYRKVEVIKHLAGYQLQPLSLTLYA